MNRYFVIIFTLLIFGGASLTEAGTIREQLEINLNQMTEIQDDDLNIDNLFDNNFSETDGKSKWKALGLSILIPGAGQYYTERKSKAAFFGSVEALVWSGFFGLRIYGDWKKEDYKSWAAIHAGADVNNKDDLFFEKLTYYDNLNEYNQLERLQEGSFAQPYPISSEYYWNWDNTQNRVHYRGLRNDSKTAFRRSLLLLGGAVVNRLLSGIDAYRSAGSYNSKMEFDELGWKFYYLAEGPLNDDKIEFGLSRRF